MEINLTKKDLEIELSQKSKTKVKGVHILNLCRVETEKAHKMQAFLGKSAENRTSILRFVEKKALEILEQGGTLLDVASWRKEGEALLLAHHAQYQEVLREFNKLFLRKQTCVENVTCTVGRSVLMQRLAGITTYSGTVSHGLLGTSATAPTIGDTQLGAETYRKALSDGTFASNVAYLENFYTTTEVNGTFEEYGFVIDGTGTANTGQLFNRFTTTTVKSALESLNVQSTITCNDA